MMNLRAATLLIAAAGLQLGCPGDAKEAGAPASPTAPTPSADPGPVDVRLAGTTGSDGAILFTVKGGLLTSVEPAAYELRSSVSAARDSAVVIVRGDLANGVIARIRLPDRHSIGSYIVQVRQVAARGTYVQRALANYQLQLVRP